MNDSYREPSQQCCRPLPRILLSPLVGEGSSRLFFGTQVRWRASWFIFYIHGMPMCMPVSLSLLILSVFTETAVLGSLLPFVVHLCFLQASKNHPSHVLASSPKFLARMLILYHPVNKLFLSQCYVLPSVQHLRTMSCANSPESCRSMINSYSSFMVYPCPPSARPGCSWPAQVVAEPW